MPIKIRSERGMLHWTRLEKAVRYGTRGALPKFNVNTFGQKCRGGGDRMKKYGAKRDLVTTLKIFGSRFDTR